MPVINRVADLHSDIAAWRRDLHAHPELLFDVQRTAGTISEKLEAFGCDEVVTGLGRTGVSALSTSHEESLGQDDRVASGQGRAADRGGEQPPVQVHSAGKNGHPW